MGKQFELMRSTAAQIGVSAGEYFVKDGLDYKGQAQYAYTVNGKGASVDVKIDPGKLLGLTAAAGAKVSLKAGKELMVFACVGPQKISYKLPNPKNAPQPEDRNVELSRPIVLGSMQGTFWEGQAGASFEAGVSFSAHAGISRSGASASASSGADGDDDESPATRAEFIGASFEASASFKADASYSYANAALEDVRPRLYGVQTAGADKAALKADATEIFASDSTKDALKTGAVEFMNQHKDIFGEQSKTRFLGISNRPTAELVEALLAGAKKIDAKTASGAALKACTENWAGKLAPYCGGFEQKGLCVLVLTSHKPEASAGFSAQVEAKAGVGPLANAGISLEVKGPAIAGSGKWSSSRFQTFWHLPDEQLLMFTQDAKISYWQVDVTGLVAEAKAEASVIDPKGTAASVKATVQAVKGPGGLANAPKPEVKRTEVVNKSGTLVDQKKVWNSLSYTSVCAYWTRPVSEAQITDGSAVQALAGSGIALGRSTILANLKQLLTACWDPVTEEFTGSKAGKKLYFMLAEALHIPVKTLAEAIWSQEVKSLIQDLTSQDAALEQALKTAPPQQAEQLRKSFAAGELPLLIEASFRLPAVDLKVHKSRDAMVKLDDKFFNNAVTAFNRVPVGTLPGLLEAVRIRVRMRDLKETAGGFRLGFKVLGQELGIGYDSIERAGAEGIVDLATFWCAKDKKSGGVAAYEAAVPKVLLFDQ